MSPEERQWLEENPSIKLSSHTNQPPFIMTDTNDKAIGIVQTMFDVIGGMINHKIELIPNVDPYNDKWTKDYGSYGIATYVNNPNMERQYVLTEKYFDTSMYVFGNRNNEKILSIDDLIGKKVAVIRNNNIQVNYAKQIENVEIVFVDSPQEQLHLVINGEVDATLGFSNYTYIIREYLMEDIVVAYTAISNLDVQIAINYEHRILANIIDKVLKKIDKSVLLEITDKWLATRLKKKALLLSESEKQYLANNVFRRATAKGWIPFSFLNENKVVGIGEDYWQLIEEKLDLSSQKQTASTFAEILLAMRTELVDVYSSTTSTTNRKEFVLFSIPYEEYPIAIATLIDEGFIADASFLNGQVVAVGRDYSAYHMMKARYPDITFLQVENTERAIREVIKGNAYAAIDILPVLQYHIDHIVKEEVKLSGITDILFPLEVMIHKKHHRLVPLVNRAITSITPTERNAIRLKWTAKEVIDSTNYGLIFYIGLGSTILIFIVFVWNYTLRKQIKLRKAAEAKYQLISVTDPLTGLFNRLKLDNVLHYELARAQRNNQTFTIILIDIDHFKNINDSFGHIVGDKVLQQVSKLLQNNLRGFDTLGRWGGEEFLVICPDCTIDSALLLAEKLRQLLISCDIASAGRVTASFGVTQYLFKDNELTILSRADKALYHAKSTGRNCVIDYNSIHD